MKINLLIFGIFCYGVQLSTANTVTCTTEFSHLNHSITKLICPENCGIQHSTLCGSGVYSQGSVCLAAMQMGLLDLSGGPVEVFKSLDNKETLTGMFQNGIQSQSCTSIGVNYGFEMTCSTTGDTQFVTTEVICPPGCQGQVYPCGNDAFHLNSSLCSAAIRAGKLTASGGHVKSYKYTNGSNVLISSNDNDNNTCSAKAWFAFSDVDACSFGNPCQNQGTCLRLQAGYGCLCTSAYTGRHCETGLGCPASKMTFSRDRTIADYVTYTDYVSSFNAATVCFWVKSATLRTVTIFSYAASGSINDFTLFFPGSDIPRFWVSETLVSPNVSIPPNTIGHLCLWFDSVLKKSGAYLNGSLADEQTYNGGATTGGGIFVVGQDQDSVGGGFQAKDSFLGALSNLMIWPRMLTSSEVDDIFRNCNCPSDYVIAMTPDKVAVSGETTYTLNETCLTGE